MINYVLLNVVSVRINNMVRCLLITIIAGKFQICSDTHGR